MENSLWDEGIASGLYQPWAGRVVIRDAHYDGSDSEMLVYNRYLPLPGIQPAGGRLMVTSPHICHLGAQASRVLYITWDRYCGDYWETIPPELRHTGLMLDGHHATAELSGGRELVCFGYNYPAVSIWNRQGCLVCRSSRDVVDLVLSVLNDYDV